ncbi:hypothetical protein GJ496_004822 [Pomphorhynchus laevis]|nr:hypothetical protein GJ496_004822 [Pomphorhynchus laevis]
MSEFKGPLTKWNSVLLVALNSLRALLSTSTNATPHERIFSNRRRSACGITLLEWLCRPGHVLLRVFNRDSKYFDATEEVRLIEANDKYATVQFGSGRIANISTRNLAPLPQDNAYLPDSNDPTETVELQVCSSTVSTLSTRQ